MTKAKTYRLSGIEVEAADIALAPSSIPPTRTSKDIQVTRGRTVVPGAARDAGAREFEAAGDEVVRVQLENGFVLWSRVDDLIRDQGKKSPDRGSGDVWEIETRPRQRGSKGSVRGWLGIGIKVLEFFGVDLKSKAALELGVALENKLLRGHTPGLYRCSLDGKLTLAAVPQGQPLATTAEPILVFIHGTGSSCQGSFGKLLLAGDEAQQVARAQLREIYSDRVYACEHRSLTESPIKNALELAQQLPKKTPIHLLTHSRGGLVGELLCLAQRERDIDPLNANTLDRLFAADHTMAEQLGLHPLQPQAATERNQAYAEDRKRLQALLKVLDEKRFTIDRFLRVACPARGTTLASGRLDRWLSVLDYVSGNSLFGDVADFLLAVVKQRTDPRTLPGLEAMMPGSALTYLLNLPDLKTASDLTVISGDSEGEGLWGQIKLFAVDWFYGAEHDLVVNTGSMYGGLRRTENGARFIRNLEIRGSPGRGGGYFHWALLCQNQ